MSSRASSSAFRAVWRLLVAISWSHLRLERLKSLLTLLGLSLGIALFLAIRIANETAWRSFTGSVAEVAPATPLRLVGDAGGVTEQILPALLRTPGVAGISPLVTAYVPAYSEGRLIGTVQLLGVDPLSYRSASGGAVAGGKGASALELLRNPHGVLLSTDLAGQRDLEFSIGGALVRVETLGTLPESGLGRAFGGRVAVIDIAHLQELTRRFGEVDAIDIELKAGSDTESVWRALEPLLPFGVHRAAPGENERYGETMTEAFRLNLNFLAGLSLVVALLLTYNSASYAVLKRRREFGIILALGGTVRALRRVVLVEAVIFGLAASLAGIILGRVLAGAASGQITGTINTLYLPVAAIPPQLSTRVIVEGMLLGPLLSVLGSLTPLRELEEVPAAATFGYQSYESAFRQGIPVLRRIGFVALVAALLTARPSLLGYHPYFGLLSPSALMIAAVCLMPGVLLVVLPRMQGLLSRLLPLEAPLAIDHISMTLRRSSVAVAAMAVAIGMYLGVSTLIASFRGTVAQWIDHVTKADIYISPPMNIGSTLSGVLPEELLPLLRQAPGVDDVDTIAARRMILGGRQVRVNGVHMPYIDKYDRLLFIEREREPRPKPELPRIYASEPAMNRLGLKLGDEMTLPGTQSSPHVVIGAIYYDFSSDQGVLLIPDDLFETMYGTREKQGLSLYLRPGVTPDDIRHLITERLPDAALFVRDNRSLRREVITIFDRTFLITYALQAIALAISGVTLLNTLLMLVLEREREFAVLRAIGAGRRALARLVVTESVLLGAAAVMGGIALGAGLALQLVFVVNRFYFGWSVHFAFPWLPLLTTVGGALILSAVVGLWPGFRVTRTVDGALLRYE